MATAARPEFSLADVHPAGPFDAIISEFPTSLSPRLRAVSAAIRTRRALQRAEGAYAAALAGLDAIAVADAAEYRGTPQYGDAYSGALRAIAAEVAVPTGQNGRGLAARISEEGRWSAQLPLLAAAHRTGRLSTAQVRAADRAAGWLPLTDATGPGESADSEQPVPVVSADEDGSGEPGDDGDAPASLRDEFERRLLAELTAPDIAGAAAAQGALPGWATEPAVPFTPRQVERLATRIAAELAPDAAADAHEQSLRDRRVHTDQLAPGLSALTVIGATVLIDAARDRLHQAARALDRADDPRSHGHREADLALALLLTGRADPAGPHALLDRIRPTVHVTVPALALAGRTDAGPAMLDDQHPVPIDVAARLCGTATQWTRVLTDPVRGTPIAADTYTPGRELRRAIQARDRHCRAPGCTIPARSCDLDHTLEWRHGGTTVPDNLACLCRYHHRMREHGWQLAQPAPGTLEWTSPSGQTYRTTPTRISPTHAAPAGPPPNGTQRHGPPPDRNSADGAPPDGRSAHGAPPDGPSPGSGAVAVPRDEPPPF